ncbi:hypothetical protein APX70_05503 [Pseudomonas syringae pv. maculicola]|uniref:Uncharacterized protein n=1 Tax=Pseudomonas syringae pv. maculicola TaxID=59511 RepID=A0A3M2WRA3_PSEYM|nr:hypothetical protein APX70_05503 [Pseudomonas syringae pv. maculicola]
MEVINRLDAFNHHRHRQALRHEHGPGHHRRFARIVGHAAHELGGYFQFTERQLQKPLDVRSAHAKVVDGQFAALHAQPQQCFELPGFRSGGILLENFQRQGTCRYVMTVQRLHDLLGEIRVLQDLRIDVDGD